LGKIKKDQPYPTIVIIPQEKEKDAWRFQESLIIVWFWRAECKWKGESRNHVFKTTSSISPIKCKTCGQGERFTLEGIEYDDKPFMEANNNPPLTYEEIQAKLRPPRFFF